MSDFVLHVGDCLEVLRTLPDNSVDSIVTDPPYELGFMGKSWDRTGIANNVEMWREALRVLKAGGHLLAFSGSRTYHRMVCAIEDAGFEVRDRVRFECSPETKYGALWESLNDEQRGMLLELINDQIGLGSELAWEYGSGFPKSKNLDGAWQRWGTALKPAHEPIVVARKPLASGTVSANVLEHGTGALNIDACRVPTDDKLGGGAEKQTTADQKGNEGWTRPWMNDEAARSSHAERVRGNVAKAEALGRWPANVIHDGSEEVLAAFPQAPGQLARASSSSSSRKNQNVYGVMARGSGGAEPRADLDKSAARFFYCAKTSRADRGEGNAHPTVKPTDLMAYLCRLVTPPGGIVLDPFMGSGSTGKAAIREGFRFIGIDKSPEYCEIAHARIALELSRVSQAAYEVPLQVGLFDAEVA